MKTLRYMLVAILILSSAALVSRPAAPALAAAPVAAPQPAQPTAPSPATLDLAGPWKFATDREEKGLAAGWQKPEFDASRWRTLNAPSSWEEQGITAPNPNWPQENGEGGYNGYAWYRKSVTIPADWTSGEVVLRIGAIHDSDWTFVNGVQVGMTTGEDAYEKHRDYTIPQTVLRPGKPNVIALRVFDVAGAGGIYDGPVELTRGVAATASVATDETAAEPPDTRTYTEHRRDITEIGGNVDVPADMQVDGDVVSVGGTVTIGGRVTGDAVAVGGSIILLDGARLDGDAVSVGGQVDRAEGAVIGGETMNTPLPGFLAGRFRGPRFQGEWWALDFVGFFWWVFIGLLAALLFPRRLEVMARALPAAPGTAALLGAAGIALVPGVIIADALIGAFVIVVLALTLVGIIAIPAAAIAMVAVIAALPLCVAFGVVAVWLSLGRAMLNTLGRRQAHSIYAMLIGLIAIWLLFRLPVFGPMIMITVAIFGAGLALMTGLGTSERWIRQRREREEIPVPPIPEPPAGPEEPITVASEELAALPEPAEPAGEEGAEAEEPREPPAI